MGWFRERDRQSPEDMFADEVAGLIQSLLGVKPKRLADFALEIDRVGDSPITMNLHNVFAETHNISGDERAARLRTAVLGMVPPPRPTTWLDAAPKLLPAVRAASWVAAGGLEGLIRLPLAPFVGVLCAIDSEHAMTFATESDLQAWGVTAADAMQTASGNLARQQVQVGRAGQIAIIMGPDGYISSWLALPSALGRIARDVGDEVIALAPARDQLVLFNTSDEAATIRQLDETLTEYQATPRQLSPVPYVIRGSQLEPWDPPDGHPARLAVDKARHVLALVEYGHQQSRLNDLFIKSGENVHAGKYMLVGRQDGSVWSWAAWSKQVTNGLVPQVDVLLLGDNDNQNAGFAVRWADAIRLAGPALQQETLFDPPLWRHRGWPDSKTLTQLKEVAVPFPPPRA